MKISLIVCTYMRPESLANLLKTVENQTKVPDEVLIIDGSIDDTSKQMINDEVFALNITYYIVPKSDRGLTKQRNYGVRCVSKTMDIIAFLDDDIELSLHYFEEICRVYKDGDNVVAVGGVTTNEVRWEKKIEGDDQRQNYYIFDGWRRRNDIRYRLREKLGLVADVQPGKIVSFGHERSIGFLPPTGKVYETDFLMGGIASYRKKIFNHLSFSTFFEGYGLYEDKDFSLQVRKLGKIYVNTNAKVEHHHDPLGRPNYVKYGKMVVWNGWRVWRVATPNPTYIDKFKWWMTTILLTYVRLGNAVIGPKRKEAAEDFVGRHLGMFRFLNSAPDLRDR